MVALGKGSWKGSQWYSDKRLNNVPRYWSNTHLAYITYEEAEILKNISKGVVERSGPMGIPFFAPPSTRMPDAKVSDEAANNVPARWKSSRDHAPAMLVYVTNAQAQLLKKLDIHGSGVDKKNHYGPDNVPSYQGGASGADGDSGADAGGGGVGGSNAGGNSPAGAEGIGIGDTGDPSGLGEASGYGGSDSYGYTDASGAAATPPVGISSNYVPQDMSRQMYQDIYRPQYTDYFSGSEAERMGIANYGQNFQSPFSSQYQFHIPNYGFASNVSTPSPTIQPASTGLMGLLSQPPSNGLIGLQYGDYPTSPYQNLYAMLR